MNVCKENLTAPEIMILRYIHGADAVTEISPTRMDKRAHAEERERLETMYSHRAGDKIEHGSDICLRLFGPSGMQLPVTLPDVAGVQEEPAAQSKKG